MRYVLLVMSLLTISACGNPTEIMRHGSYDLIIRFDNDQEYYSLCTAGCPYGKDPDCVTLNKEQYLDLKNKIIKIRQSQRNTEAQEMIDKANAEFNQ